MTGLGTYSNTSKITTAAFHVVPIHLMDSAGVASVAVQTNAEDHISMAGRGR